MLSFKGIRTFTHPLRLIPSAVLILVLYLDSVYNVAVMTAWGTNFCEYWSCTRRIRDDHFLCIERYDDWQEGFIDQCPSCGRFKDSSYELCLDCAQGRKPKQRKPTTKKPPSNQSYKLEHSKAWEKADKEAVRFFVYILKLSDGSFYVGQTRELRERMSEHRDNKTPSTAGKNPKLQFFAIMPDRKTATLAEVVLKKLVDSNPRQIRRMIIGFQDLMREVQLD